MEYAAIIAAAIQLVGSVVGMVKGDEDREKALALLKKSLGGIEGLDIPKLTDDVIKQQASSLGDYRDSPEVRSQQLRALDALGQEVSSQGMTAQDRAAYQRAQLEAGREEAGLRGAAQQRLVSRGLGSSTAGYMGDMMASQSAATRSAMAGTEAAGQARERYLRALESLGSMSGNVRQQDFGQAQAKAAAQDAINRFNAQQGYQAQVDRYRMALERLREANAVRGQMAGFYQQQGQRGEQRGAALGGAGSDLALAFGSMGGGK